MIDHAKYAKKMDEANAILIMQKHNAQATQAEYEKILEEKRAVWRLEVKAEKLRARSEPEIEPTGKINPLDSWERDEQAFEDYQRNKFGLVRFGK
jgi:hypothetical protein